MVYGQAAKFNMQYVVGQLEPLTFHLFGFGLPSSACRAFCQRLCRLGLDQNQLETM